MTSTATEKPPSFVVQLAKNQVKVIIMNRNQVELQKNIKHEQKNYFDTFFAVDKKVMMNKKDCDL